MRRAVRKERERIQAEVHQLLLEDQRLRDLWEDSGQVRYAVRLVMDVVHDQKSWHWWSVKPHA